MSCALTEPEDNVVWPSVFGRNWTTGFETKLDVHVGLGVGTGRQIHNLLKVARVRNGGSSLLDEGRAGRLNRDAADYRARRVCRRSSDVTGVDTALHPTGSGSESPGFRIFRVRISYPSTPTRAASRSIIPSIANWACWESDRAMCFMPSRDPSEIGTIINWKNRQRLAR